MRDHTLPPKQELSDCYFDISVINPVPYFYLMTIISVRNCSTLFQNELHMLRIMYIVLEYVQSAELLPESLGHCMR